MKRVLFSQVLKDASIDIRKEYGKLYDMFCVQRVRVDFLSNAICLSRNNITIRDFCADNFGELPPQVRGTCLSLNEFDKLNRFRFKRRPFCLDINYLISFCEYSYNLITCIHQCLECVSSIVFSEKIQLYLRQVKIVVEKLGFMPNTPNGITDFVPKDQVAVTVAKLIDPSLSFRVIEYNHHSMRGDLDRKRETLLALSNKLEPHSGDLAKVNQNLKNDLFCFLNNLNIRHNNVEGLRFNPCVASMKDSEIEQWYDETYQMFLRAFLELDYLKKKDRIDQLKKNLKNK